jgi:hypothetical protein
LLEGLTKAGDSSDWLFHSGVDVSVKCFYHCSIRFVGSEPWVHALAEVKTVEEVFMVAHNIHGICVAWNIVPLVSEDILSFILQEDGCHALKRGGKS